MVNVSDFKGFVEKINKDINEKYDGFSYRFAEERKKLINNKNLVSKNALFSLIESHLSENYDFNLGGHGEVQYHIDRHDRVYYGLGFCFETYIRDKANNKFIDPLSVVKLFTDALFEKEVKMYLNTLIDKGFSPYIYDSISDIESFKNPEFGKYYFFGKAIEINNDEISDEDYEQMLKDFTTDLFELYKKIFETRNKLVKNLGINSQDNLLNIAEELLKSNNNLILTGAPGTGKTYLAKQIAAKMIFGEDISLKEIEQNVEKKKKFNKQYKFVQFHPSYDYTDFVEGIRPVTKEGGSYGFERKDGVFKEFCKKAEYFTFIISVLKDFCRDIESTIKNGQEYITYGRGNKEQEAKINQISIEDDHVTIYFTVNKSITILFNEFPDMYIRYCITNINNMVEDTNYISGKNSHHTYYYGFLKTFYNKYHDNIIIPNSCDNENKAIPFIFVIDEINRGDINKILGELFYALDLGYRGEKGKVDTQYQNLVNTNDVFADGFYIPENVYIIGTMNDIDRSVESMDFAIRRRFAWHEVKPEDTADEILKNLEIDNVVFVLNEFNKFIANHETLGEMYKIGASYFLKLDKYFKEASKNNEDKAICTQKAYEKLWDNHLKGLIHEYIRGKKYGNVTFEAIEKEYKKLTSLNIEINNEDAEQ